ncbi:MAG: (P)ppGpp synthetase I, SpoT/RelA [Candidatus Peribacteria bacterium GW2011_GWB1_54_5]|nr:MAG: (P)ppGpp synthetase I, SpoT/RelA [Candidatus Peribacteria bacterium GW2011_GWB1_54_5]
MNYPTRMASKTTSGKKDTQGLQYQRWISFLTCVRDTPQNQDLLLQYFLEQFLGAPELFYEFLFTLQKKLELGRKKTVKEQLAREYLRVLSPLCERFGMFEEKETLDHLCFRIAYPTAYREVEQVLSKYQKTAEHTIQKILRILRTLLKKEHFTCTVKGRYKNVYSIYQKMQKKRYVSPIALNDIFAFRIIVKSNDAEKCFEIINLLHDYFHPSVDRFKDYISVPKVNGYQSIHTTLRGVIPDFDLPVEIQVRTEMMDGFADRGIASHWIYSRNKKTSLLTEPERKLLDHYTSLSERLQQERNVYFFSFEGDINKLPEGSSVLDFAYRIHTEIGNHAKAALVNGKEQPVHYRINEGDRIRILTAESLQVSGQRLSCVHTSLARRKIHEYAEP